MRGGVAEQCSDSGTVDGTADSGGCGVGLKWKLERLPDVSSSGSEIQPAKNRPPEGVKAQVAELKLKEPKMKQETMHVMRYNQGIDLQFLYTELDAFLYLIFDPAKFDCFRITELKG